MTIDADGSGSISRHEFLEIASLAQLGRASNGSEPAHLDPVGAGGCCLLPAACCLLAREVSDPVMRRTLIAVAILPRGSQSRAQRRWRAETPLAQPDYLAHAPCTLYLSRVESRAAGAVKARAVKARAVKVVVQSVMDIRAVRATVERHGPVVTVLEAAGSMLLPCTLHPVPCPMLVLVGPMIRSIHVLGWPTTHQPRLWWRNLRRVSCNLRGISCNLGGGISCCPRDVISPPCSWVCPRWRVRTACTCTCTRWLAGGLTGGEWTPQGHDRAHGPWPLAHHLAGS